MLEVAWAICKVKSHSDAVLNASECFGVLHMQASNEEYFSPANAVKTCFKFKMIDLFEIDKTKSLKMIVCANICIIFEPNKTQNILTRFD